MNETITLLKNRKSVRKYTDQPLPDSVKKEILEAALCAPSAGAMMLYSIIEVEDQSLKEKLAVSCDHGQHNYIRKFTADFSLEMTRSVREIFKKWQNEAK
ncbi:MAG: nitroreductase family protein [Flexilinea sp.]|jgi:nitroreductase